MKKLPHRYHVVASGQQEGTIAVSSEGLETLSSAPPVEFGGPGDLWSPETLLVAAVVDCYVLTFRAIARASSLEWLDLRCEGAGTLDRVDRTTKFTSIDVRATLEIEKPTDQEKAERLLQKTETACLITHSLACPIALETLVTVR